MRALDDVDFSIAPGEIVALLGQNGAGKSTLIQIFAGAHAAGSYDGAISFRGDPYRPPANVAEAEAAGVALVPQEVNIVSDLTVAENITLNDEPTRWGMIDVARTAAGRDRQLSPISGSTSSPNAPMSSLDLATQQLIVIARALAKKARLLILDEPTAALTETRIAAPVRPDARAEGARRCHHFRFPSAGRGLRDFRPHRRHARRPHPRPARHCRRLARRRSSPR